MNEKRRQEIRNTISWIREAVKLVQDGDLSYARNKAEMARDKLVDIKMGERMAFMAIKKFSNTKRYAEMGRAIDSLDDACESLEDAWYGLEQMLDDDANAPDLREIILDLEMAEEAAEDSASESRNTGGPVDGY